ncbi:hypothetical protein D7V80_11755 [Corallococcus sp. CA054B]|nr:hypothetical protein D7V80_11755 [Corallococcus sp. CA054B]
MYKLLHKLRRELSMHCECKAQALHQDQVDTVRGERMNVDFFWYELDSKQWSRPTVVIEHENVEEGALLDFWKVTLLDAPLRVFIGYARTKAGVTKLFERLTTQEGMDEWRVPAGAADLVILGDYEECLDFTAWTRTAGAAWSRLGSAPAPQLEPLRPRPGSAEKRPWSPNDIVRSVDAYVQVRESPAQRGAVVAALATATGRSLSAAEAGMDAVGRADPGNGTGPELTPFAQVLATFLLANQKELRRLIGVINTQEG